MIEEVIVTTLSAEGIPHIAPMGIHVVDETRCVIKPFRPSKTLDNLQHTGSAVINYCDDVRIFAGCLTGRRDWSLVPSSYVPVPRLENCLTHVEVKCEHFTNDEVRPEVHCSQIHIEAHKPFKGFNRAQFSVIEAAILASRLNMLSPEKIQQELDYLKIGLVKTAGERERQAWDWIMDWIENHAIPANVYGEKS